MCEIIPLVCHCGITLIRTPLHSIGSSKINKLVPVIYCIYILFSFSWTLFLAVIIDLCMCNSVFMCLLCATINCPCDKLQVCLFVYSLSIILYQLILIWHHFKLMQPRLVEKVHKCLF